MAAKVTFSWNDDAFLDSVGDFVSAALTKTVADCAADVKDAMAEPKSGHVYVRQGAAHQAAGPGEAPAIDTGAMVNEVGFRAAEKTESGYQAEFRSDAEQSMALNDGHVLPNGEWWEGSHFMEAAWESNLPALKEAFRAKGFRVR